MFWDLNGATRIPRCLRIRHSAVTSTLLPACEAVPTTIKLPFICVPSERSSPPAHFVAGPYNPEPLHIDDSEDSLFAKSNRSRNRAHSFRPNPFFDIGDCARFRTPRHPSLGAHQRMSC